MKINKRNITNLIKFMQNKKYLLLDGKTIIKKLNNLEIHKR